MAIQRWMITLVLTLVVLSGLYFYKQHLIGVAQSQNISHEPVMTVEAHTSGVSEFQKRVKVNGEVKATQRLVLQNEVAGVIAKVNFASGDIVRQGQVLLELDHNEELARLQGAKAREVLAQKTLVRFNRLLKSKEISEDQRDGAVAELKQAKAEVAQLKAIIAKKVFVAPFDARVGIHSWLVGQYLDGNTEIATLIGVEDTLWVDFTLPQTYPLLEAGDEIRVDTVAGTHSYLAKVIAVAPQIDTRSRSLSYRAEISQASELKPNTLVSLSIPVSEAKQVIQLPDLAVARDQHGTFVYVLAKEGEQNYRAKRTPVVVGERDNKRVVILEGLEAAQLVATKGAFKLWPEVKVSVTQIIE